MSVDLWPGERVVVGQISCKKLREVLAAHALCAVLVFDKAANNRAGSVPKTISQVSITPLRVRVPGFHFISWCGDAGGVPGGEGAVIVVQGEVWHGAVHC